jgi:hypothetical protein
MRSRLRTAKSRSPDVLENAALSAEGGELLNVETEM